MASTVMAEAIADLHADEDLGSVATFTPATGAAVPDCHVIIGFDQQLSGGDTTAQVFSLGTTISYLLAEIGRAVRSGETFTVGVTTYTISDQVANNGIRALVLVQ